MAASAPSAPPARPARRRFRPADAAAFLLAATISATATAATPTAPVAFTLTASPIALTALAAAALDTRFALRPVPVSARAALRPAALSLTFTAHASVSVNTSAQWRQHWLDVHAARQSVLNAIDANNRALAKQAGSAAQAAADAVVATNTRIDVIDDTLTAEAIRIAALTTRITAAETDLTAHGSALTTLQTTTSAHGQTLTSHATQLTSVSTSITNLNGQVTNIASAQTLLQVEVDSLGAAKGTWGVYFDINGHISGLQSINDGIKSEFNVSASAFRLLNPGAANGMEIQDGHLRVWRGGTQRIIGNGFGVGGELMDYFGPSVGAANANKTNAVMWMDRDGNAAFNGQITAGNIVGTFQSGSIIDWSGSVLLCAAFQPPLGFQVITTFTLPAPVLAGQTHVPMITLSVGLNELTRGVRIVVDELHNTTWMPIIEHYPPHVLVQRGSNRFPAVWERTITISGIGSPTTTACQFRVRAASEEHAISLTENDLNAYVISVKGYAVGLR